MSNPSKCRFILGLILLMPMCLVETWAAPQFKVLYAFTGRQDGGEPVGAPIFDSNGNLYGSTSSYGGYTSGSIYELTPTPSGSWTMKVLHQFRAGEDGEGPWASLIFDAAGNLYGTTQYGSYSCGRGCPGGTAFRLSPNGDGSWNHTVIHQFTGRWDGGDCLSNLTWDFSGNLYGTCDFGGSNGWGVVYQLHPDGTGGWTENVIKNFDLGREGGYTWASGVVFGPDGALYGVTRLGANHGDTCSGYGCGIVYALSPQSDGTWKEQVLHSFLGRKDGAEPLGNLLLDNVGQIYGAAYLGGNSDKGVVYRMTPGAGSRWTGTTLHAFTGGRDGANPNAGLVSDASGNLYGIATFGGAHGYGTVFELSPVGNGLWSGTVLHAFTGGWDGSYPVGSLTVDAAGNIFGAAMHGAVSKCTDDIYKGCGVVFEIIP
jgi:uncharacterized repeat protein (TIGR03803 family)